MKFIIFIFVSICILLIYGLFDIVDSVMSRPFNSNDLIWIIPVFVILYVLGIWIFTIVVNIGMRKGYDGTETEKMIKKWFDENRRNLMENVSSPVERVRTAMDANGFSGMADSFIGFKKKRVDFTCLDGKHIKTGWSKSGGLPDMKPGDIWPRSKKRNLDFLMQINLADIKAIVQDLPLPDKGLLLFFYDLYDMPNAYRNKTLPGWKVLYYEDVSLLRKMEKKNGVSFGEQAIEFEVHWDLPSSSDKQCAVLTEQEGAKLMINNARELGNAKMIECGYDMEGLNDHLNKLFGYPDFLVESTEEMKKKFPFLYNHQEWVLLAQVGGLKVLKDERWSFGIIDFFIKMDDLKACNFNDIMVI